MPTISTMSSFFVSAVGALYSAQQANNKDNGERVARNLESENNPKLEEQLSKLKKLSKAQFNSLFKSYGDYALGRQVRFLKKPSSTDLLTAAVDALEDKEENFEHIANLVKGYIKEPANQNLGFCHYLKDNLWLLQSYSEKLEKKGGLPDTPTPK